MTTLGTWYPPALGTGGFLIEGQLFTNPPFHPMTDKASKLRLAVAEAQRFIERAEEYLHELDAGTISSLCGCRQSGAAKRASMDLTRALADYRRPF